MREQPLNLCRSHGGPFHQLHACTSDSTYWSEDQDLRDPQTRELRGQAAAPPCSVCYHHEQTPGDH